MTKNQNSKKWLTIIIAAVAAVVLAFVLQDNNVAKANQSMKAEESIVNQRIVGMYEKPVPITKVYYQDKLLGAIYDTGILERAKDQAYDLYYRDYFENASIKYNEDIYLYEEKTYMEY